MFPNTVKLLRKKNPLPLSDPLQSLNAFLDKDGLLRVGVVNERLRISASTDPSWKALSVNLDHTE
jgi:hypothetical protein